MITFSKILNFFHEIHEARKTKKITISTSPEDHLTKIGEELFVDMKHLNRVFLSGEASKLLAETSIDTLCQIVIPMMQQLKKRKVQRNIGATRYMLGTENNLKCNPKKFQTPLFGINIVCNDNIININDDDNDNDDNKKNGTTEKQEKDSKNERKTEKKEEEEKKITNQKEGEEKLSKKKSEKIKPKNKTKQNVTLLGFLIFVEDCEKGHQTLKNLVESALKINLKSLTSVSKKLSRDECFQVSIKTGACGWKSFATYNYESVTSSSSSTTLVADKNDPFHIPCSINQVGDFDIPVYYK